MEYIETIRRAIADGNNVCLCRAYLDAVQSIECEDEIAYLRSYIDTHVYQGDSRTLDDLLHVDHRYFTPGLVLPVTRIKYPLGYALLRAQIGGVLEAVCCIYGTKQTILDRSKAIQRITAWVRECAQIKYVHEYVDDYYAYRITRERHKKYEALPTSPPDYYIAGW